MGRRILIIALTFTMMFIFVQYSTAAPVPGPAWNTTDNDSNIYTLASLSLGLNSGWSFGVYDYANGISGTHLSMIDDTNVPATFIIDGNGDIKVTAGISSGSILNLVSPNYFGFYFYNSGSNYYNYTYSQVAENQWALQYTGAGGPVFASDVTLVPLATSAIFLFSGLLGLSGIKRRFKS